MHNVRDAITKHSNFKLGQQLAGLMEKEIS